MKKTLLLMGLVCWSYFALAQVAEPKVKFGTYNLADLEMKSYPKDSSAEAVVLYDFADYYYTFQDNYPTVVYNFHKRIKILKKSGLERGTITIPFRWESTRDRQEVVNEIKGITYNIEDGSVKMTELTKKSIFEEKSSNSVREIKIVFPQVKEGSVIELTYTINSPLWYFLRTWSFQKDIPVVWSGIKAMIPGYFDYKITYFGYHPFAIKESREGKGNFLSRSDIKGQEITDPYLAYHFAMKDLPALKADDYMTTVEDYRSSIDFELARTFFPSSGEHNYSITYKDLTKTLLEDSNYGNALKKFGKTARKIAAEITAKSPSKDTLTLISNAYDYIRTTMKWNEEARLGTTAKLDQIYEAKQGNASEINLILVGVLQELGFDANPVVLSTRDHGKVLVEIALMDRFNYSVAHMMINGKDFLLDATDRYVKMNMLPKRCLNERGWLISKNPKWVSLAPTERKQINTQLSFTIGEDQQLQGQFSEAYLGYANAEKKIEINNIGVDKYIEKLKSRYTQFDKPEITMKENESKETIIECKTTVNEAYTMAGDRIFVHPLLWKTQTQSPFLQAERKYPVDFGYSIQETISGKYTIPKGYSVETMPTYMNIYLPNNKGRYLFMIKAENGVIEVMSQLLLAKSVFTADEYYDLRELFSKMIAKQNEQIVLKKN
jgi:hypothetical protein